MALFGFFRKKINLALFSPIWPFFKCHLALGMRKSLPTLHVVAAVVVFCVLFIFKHFIIKSFYIKQDVTNYCNMVLRRFRQFYIDFVFYGIAMAKTTRRRDIRKIFNSSYLGLKHIQVSLCNLTVAQTLERLLDKAQTTISANSRLKIDSWACLLCELDLNRVLLFESAYQEYAAKV